MKTQQNLTVNNKKVARNMWGEIFRLFCIVLILFTHFQSQNKIFNPLVNLSRIGVLGFIIISGFYSANSTTWRTKKMLVKTIILSIWGFVLIGSLYWSKIPGAQNPFEVLFGWFYKDKYSSWWFLYIYLAFTLFQPFINKFIHTFNKWVVFGIILVVALCVTAMNSYCSLPPIYFVISFNQLFVFAWVYAIAAWISKYYKDIIESNKFSTKFSNISIWCILFVGFFLCAWYLPIITNWFNKHEINYVSLHEPISFGAALCAFMFLMFIPKINNYKLNKAFSIFGESTLFVYLFHGSIWSILDLIKWSVNLHLKFLIYFIITFVLGIVLYFFISIQEKGAWYLINKVKNNFISIKC